MEFTIYVKNWQKGKYNKELLEVFKMMVCKRLEKIKLIRLDENRSNNNIIKKRNKLNKT